MTIDCSINSVLIIGGAALSGCLCLFALLRRERTQADLAFAAGMLLLALEGGISALSIRGALPAEIVVWEYWRLVLAGLASISWLLFSLCYVRENYKELLARWMWGVIGAALVLLLLVTLFAGSLFTDVIPAEEPGRWLLRLGWSGHISKVLTLLLSVSILLNLERTLHASFGDKRWRIKFMLLGVGALFAVRTYALGQMLLYSAIDTKLVIAQAWTLLIADIMIAVSLFRTRQRTVTLYLSQQALCTSITAIVVGAYLLLVGVLAKAAQYFDIGDVLLQNNFFVFLALLGCTILMLSSQLRNEIKRFTVHHFRQPRHDYRALWAEFTRTTAFIVNRRDLCTAVARMVSEVYGVSAVTIWTLDNTNTKPAVCGSTCLSQDEDFSKHADEVGFLLLSMRRQETPVDLDREEWGTRDGNVDRIRYCAPLMAGSDFLGILTLNSRMTGEPFSIEDLDLLKTIADQTAGMIFTRRLMEQIEETKEIEAFQTLSTFFAHDLKNLASTLSLTLQNLPLYYDNPEFREDAQRVIAQSVEKINTMCSRLSLAKQTLELKKIETDLNRIVTDTLSNLSSAFKTEVTQELQSLPKTLVDPDQIQKVLTNLILNASEAMENNGGHIKVKTGREDDSVVISVSDTGCGIPKEFMQRSLFHPFKTTKKRGMGIGLYQCKTIVEGHQGRIEVESEEGKGSTFRIVLPLP